MGNVGFCLKKKRCILQFENTGLGRFVCNKERSGGRRPWRDESVLQSSCRWPGEARINT